MTKRVLATYVEAVILLATGAAAAQSQTPTSSDAPQWLKDRRYGEGIGIRTGDLELHPGIAGEFGYDSNYFLRSDKDIAKPVDTLRLRITPSFILATIRPPPREAAGGTPEPPQVTFRPAV